MRKAVCSICCEGPCECGYFKLPFGKHKDERIMDVYDDDPKYIEWLAENTTLGPVKDRLQAFLEEA